jgi:hypothetical protein
MLGLQPDEYSGAELAVTDPGRVTEVSRPCCGSWARTLRYRPGTSRTKTCTV